MKNNIIEINLYFNSHNPPDFHLFMPRLKQAVVKHGEVIRPMKKRNV
jgi:hypothetical protein